MSEIWKDIKGYEGLYQVSSLGRFRSMSYSRVMSNGVERRYEEKLLTPYESTDGYLLVNLSNGKTRTSYKAHRLVAEAFVKNTLNLPLVNHRNENKQDNRAENLEWCTNRYNLKYGTTQKRRVEKIGWKVRQFKLDGTYIRTYVSMRAAARLLKIPMSGIYDNCNGKTKSYKGYIFKKVRE